jgi:hypothetical protein
MMRRAFSAWLTALLLIVSVVVPALDRGGLSNETVLESEHSAASCLRGHDHTICTQVEANLLVASTPPVRGRPFAISESAPWAGVFTPLQTRHLDGRRSRAPPQV